MDHTQGAGMTGDVRTIESPHPVRAGERAASIDVLRGFALLGILAVNIMIFAWPFDATMNPSLAAPYEGGARWGFAAMSVLFFGKMVFLFSMLFGAGVTFYSRKFEGDRLTAGAGLWYRRMAILLVLGLFHAFILWYGDVLVWYAFVGLTALWWLRKLPTAAKLTLFVLGVLWYAAVSGGFFWLDAQFSQDYDPELPWYATPDAFETEMAIYTGELGGFGLQVLHRMLMCVFMYIILLPLIMGPYLLGVMLGGQALTTLGVLTGKAPGKVYAAMACLGLPIGVLLGLLGLGNTEAMMLEGAGVSVWRVAAGTLAGPVLGLGYVGVLVGLWKMGVLGPVGRVLAAVGRMALTNYLLQTIICTTLFYSHGFGLYGTIPYPQLWGVVAGVWCVNIALSVVWLRFFRFGPAEWAWRCLTYLKLEPIRRQPTA